jgi:hypothetical protein
MLSVVWLFSSLHHRNRKEAGMTFLSAQPPANRRRLGWLLAGLLVAMGVFGAFWWPGITSAASPLFAPDPVTAAWEKAKAAGSYRFMGDITQVTIPTARITNVGRSSRTEKFRLEGQNNLRAETLEMTLWSDSGSIVQAESGRSVRVEGGKTFTRQGAGDWKEIDNFTDALAPQGDFLAYLQAIREVRAHAPENRQGIAFTRYTFQMDGPAFAAHLRDQMAARLRTTGELPPGMTLELPAHYRDMTGHGELWVGATGLPLRQILTLQFPEQKNEQIQTQLVMDFSHYGKATPGQTLPANSVQSWLHAALGITLPDLTPVLALLPFLVGVSLLLYYRRSRLLQHGLAAAVITSLVIGPILTTYTQVRFFDAQSAKAASQDAQQSADDEARATRAALGSAEFNPHLNPMSKVETETQSAFAAPLGLPEAEYLAAPAALLTDNGVDTDSDGLTDFVEERIGTSPLLADSDDDAINDLLEVQGFQYGGQQWYTDPLAPDSNRDGQSDLLEWSLDSAGNPLSTPLDTDGDNIPDLFDLDNDNDGVADRKDLAPFVTGATAFTENAPFRLQVDNLTADKPTFVEFQIRPQNPQQLWFAFNVLDWPQDSDGQMRDIDQKTYADRALAQGRSAAANEANGDMKLIPMLEIRIPGTPTNLPTPEALAPYNIIVNDFTADGSTKVAYVPLNVVTDETTGERMAFSGRMYYQSDGSWPAPHEARLVWVVQALFDLACDPTDAAQVAQGCEADGYIHNVPQLLHRYYEDWALTGLTVREDHGAGMAVVYEDPTADSDLKDEAALWALSFGLDNAFITGRDQDSDNQRDVDLTELVHRFDRTQNSGVSETERWAVPNILRVDKADFATLDQAIVTTAMTTTKNLLDSQFATPWSGDKAIKPLLLFAHEAHARSLGLDSAAVGGGYVTWNGADLRLDLAPTPATAQPVQVMAGLKWAAYCAPDGATPAWAPCAIDDYWDELERRYASVPGLPGENDPDLVTGRLFAAQLYYLTFSAGAGRLVQEGPRIVSGVYSLLTDTLIEASARYGLQVVGATAPVLADLLVSKKFNSASTVTKFLSSAYRSLQNYRQGNLSASLVKWNIKQGLLRLGRSPANTFGVVAAIGLALFQWASLIPTNSPEANRAVLAIGGVLMIALTIVQPILEIRNVVRGGTSLAKALTAVAEVSKAVRVASVVGLVIGIGLSWGFFIYSMVENQISAFSPEFNRALAEAIAATIFAIFLFVLSATVIGGLIVAIVAVIDFLLTIICELGVTDLRKAPGLGGACFTLTNAAIKGIAYFLYNYDLMVDLSRNDFIVTGSPDTTLADPSKGFVTGNALTIQLPVTTTLYHKDADPANGLYIFFYHYLFSADNLRSSTVRYSLSYPDAETLTVARDQMTNEWQNVTVDHYQAAQPMHRGEAVTSKTISGLNLPAGINRATEFYFNMGYAVPAYECFGLPLPPFYIPIPVCYTRENTGNHSTNLQSLKFDIFPTTLDGFMTLASKGDGGQGLNWDPAFRSLVDADGDGLFSAAAGGLDPNDTSVDSDNDGLIDSLELERRALGTAISPITADSDGDGLTDRSEIELGSDPGVADTDNDGLSDSVELNGWDVVINGLTPLTIRVISDPAIPDSDNDGLSDQAERALANDPTPANRIDKENRPYHPNVFNTPPVAIFLATNDGDGFLGHNQTLIYTTTVVAHQALAPGTLQVTPPSELGSAPDPYALFFDPLTFSGSQTVTQQTNFTVGGGAGEIVLNSTVNTRLPGSGATWAWSPATTEAGLGSFSGGKVPTFIQGVPSTADRQDSYRLIGQTAVDSLSFFARGDVWTFDLPGGASRTLEDDLDRTTEPDRFDNAALRSNTAPAVSCNAAGVCMAVWSELSQCSTITIDWLRVDTAGADHGTSGIEPIIFFVADGADTDPTNGGYELLWTPGGAGGGDDMTSGTQRGPNANNFPITRSFCTPARLELYETDGINPPDINWATQTRIAGYDLTTTSGAREVTFSGDGHVIRLSLTGGVDPSPRLAAALLAPDGTIQRPQFAVTAPTGDSDGDSTPLVATDGVNFLVAWQRLDGYSRQLTANSSTIAFRTELLTRLFDGAGNPLTTESVLTGDRLEFYSAAINITSALNAARATLNRIDLDWIGDRYRLTRGINLGAAAGDPNLEFEDNGVPSTLTGRVTWRDIDGAGALIAGSKATVYGLGGNDAASSHSLVYNPSNQQLLLVHASGGTLLAQNFSSPSATTVTAVPWDTGVANAVAAYHAPTRGYLIGWTDTDNTARPFQYQVRDRDLNPIGGNVQEVTWPVTVNSAVGTALACPAAQSAPVAELRFEELPGFGLFTNTAIPENFAFCDTGNCPAAGLPGAPNAPLSDYALRFDGVNDRAFLQNTRLPGSFSAAFWVKAAPGANSDGLLIDHGAAAANGWSFFLSNGRPALRIGTNQTLTSPNAIDNDQWRFVVATRSSRTGAVALYVDGALVASSTFSTAQINGITLITIGGTQSGDRYFNGHLEHLQLYPAALSAETVQALYNRTLQSYCVAAATPTTGTTFPWSRLRLEQQDTRGGRITVSNSLPLIIDNDQPTASFTALTNNSFLPGNATTIIGGNASDATSGVDFVEIQVDGGPWQRAEGAETWTFGLTVGASDLTIRTRATDRVGNVGPESPALTLRADAAAPQVTLNPSPNTVLPTQNATGQWQVTLTGAASDGAGSGVAANSVEVRLTQQSGVGPILNWQPATLTGNSWTINYLFPTEQDQITDAYNVQVRAADTIGNRTTDNGATGVVRLDNTAPIATIDPLDAARQVISQTITISGLVTDTNSIVGLDTVEIAFTPLSQVAALPANITGDAAEALLDRTWHPVTLAQRGPGNATSSWSFQIPADLENQYQIDLRTTDLLGNSTVGGYAARTVIDTRDPRVTMTATATGATYFDAAANQEMNEIRFVCTATDRHLTEESFVCPGNTLQPPVRAFTDDPALQALFPDWTIRSGLANTYTLWLSTTTPIASVTACDAVGRCATASSAAGSVAGTSAGSVAGVAAASTAAVAAAPGAPTAVIVNPTNGSFVAAGNAISVTVAAEAGAGLKDVTIKLDNAVVQTLSFAQSPAITRTLRTVNVPISGEGQHTLVAEATAWDNSAQTTLFPVVFTLDQNAPTVTIDASVLTLADTWQAQSGILRFNGNASDSVGLATVQIREGSNDFTDATFGSGTWRVALPVADPEGRTLSVIVRAIDRAGRISEVTQAIATDLSATDAPDTTISSGPANPSAANNAEFVFTGSATAAVFECQLDNSVYTPCVSPAGYSDLSKGGHTFRVRALDSRGLPDLTPAEYTWTVNAGQPDATITASPTNPTTERTATFTFSGDATATSFECSLDGSAYGACSSPVSYNNLGNGEHTFLVRAVDGSGKRGAADRYVWTVLNLAPIANDQTVVVIPNQAKAVTLTATDNEPLLYTIVTPPAHGVLSGIAPNLTYSPDTNYGGPDSFTFKASDGLAESNVATVTIFVDNVPPVVTCSVTPNNLWPPNHKLVDIQATVNVSDLHSGPAGFTLVFVTSSEADSGLDNADVPNDIQNWVADTPDVVGQLRAERSDAGNGRTYTLTYEGKDLANNKALCTTTVTVPKNQGGGGKATYDENQVLVDEYLDAQPAPADPVATPTVATPNSDTVVIDPATLTLRLFLPLVQTSNASE